MFERISFNLRIYLLLVLKSIKGSMQYRMDFFIGTICTAVESGVSLLVIVIMFGYVTNIEGWTFSEMFFIYAFSLLTVIPQYTFFNNMWWLSGEVRSGRFTTFYLKPINMLLYFLGRNINIGSAGNIVLAVVTFIISSRLCKITWDLGNISFFIVSFTGSSLIFASLFMMSACLCFFVSSNNALVDFIVRFNLFARYPTSIFKGFIRFLLTYIIPVAFLGYYPALHFLRPHEAGTVVYASPFIGAALFIIAYRVWKAGIDRYSGSGT